MVRTRFAPSPNGPLHLGHAYAAMVAHDLAVAQGGAFILRIEDIDGDRSRAEHIKQSIEDLRWLGLSWHGDVVYQSARLESYAAAAARLKAMGLLYPCRCSRAEIAATATQNGPDGPIYPGTCRGAVIAPDSDVVWRLDMAKARAQTGPLTWCDELAGEQVATPQIFGDVVLVRSSAPASYHLAATLDDAADGISLVTRGADLFAASHIHRLLQELLGLPVPRWHHHPLLMEDDKNGQVRRKLAKRRGSPSLVDMRRQGVDGEALAADLRAGKLPSGISLGGTLVETL